MFFLITKDQYVFIFYFVYILPYQKNLFLLVNCVVRRCLKIDIDMNQGTNARKVNSGRVYSGYILKPVLSGRTLLTRKDASVFVYYPRRLKAFYFDIFENSHNSFL